jgi:hypothetical protein
VLSGRIAGKPGMMPESRVVELWRNCLPGGHRLLTEDGDTVRLIYPGRRNHGGGADFLDAVIATDRGVLKGDIEIHVRSSGWWEHGHYLDPAYNRVIMHVVYGNDTDRAIRLHDGRNVPTLVLDGLPEIRAGQSANSGFLPCHDAGHRLSADQIGHVLDAAGEARFQAKAAGFRGTPNGPGQALYEAIMASLGYSANKLQFLKLARQVPLHRLESITSGSTNSGEYLANVQSMLLGVAGLLPTLRPATDTVCRNSEWVRKLEEQWHQNGNKAALYAGDWHLSGIRPANLPVRRIAAMSHLLVRYRRTGLLAGLTGGLDQLNNAVKYSDLEQKLLVDAVGYWKLNLDYHLPARKTAPALLGRGRAADIIVNVLLPFAAVNISGGPAAEIYHACPRLTVNNLERHMLEQLGLDSRMVDSARRQQGLLHIYRAFCSQGKCSECPLNRQIS